MFIPSLSSVNTVICAIILSFSAFMVSALTTPMDTSVQECDPESLINCEYTDCEKYDDGDNKFILPAGQYSYSVFLPSGYFTDTEKRYPCLFVFTPSGDTSLFSEGPYVRNNSWISVILMASCNQMPVQNCIANFVAAHDDAVKRFRINNDMKVITGSYSAASIAGMCMARRPGFRSFISQLGTLPQNEDGEFIVRDFKKDRNLSIYMILGNKSYDIRKAKKIDDKLPHHTKRKIVNLVIENDMISPEYFSDAMAWALAQSVKTADNVVGGKNGIYTPSIFEKAKIDKKADPPHSTTKIPATDLKDKLELQPKPVPTNVIPLNKFRPIRTWTTISGVETSAAAIYAADGIVTLRRADNSALVKVREDTLCESDRAYLNKIRIK